MAFAPISRGSALPCPARRRMSNDAAGFASCYGPHRRSPIRAFDAGLRPGPFPGRAASLLPGLLAATRTGLPPAGDDELTNTKIHHGITSRCHLLLCWAHERSGLTTLISLPWTVSHDGELRLRPRLLAAILGTQKSSEYGRLGGTRASWEQTVPMLKKWRWETSRRAARPRRRMPSRPWTVALCSPRDRP